LFSYLKLNYGFLVEAGGIEPPSEKPTTETSPGAAGCWFSRRRARIRHATLWPSPCFLACLLRRRDRSNPV